MREGHGILGLVILVPEHDIMVANGIVEVILDDVPACDPVPSAIRPSHFSTGFTPSSLLPRV